MAGDAVDDAVAFAEGLTAAAGGTSAAPEAEADLRAAIRGEITFDDAVDRAYRRITG